jgi:hypothetical protein
MRYGPWDITNLNLESRIKVQYYYLYMIEGIYSRKIVGYEVHENECGSKESEMVQRSCWSEHKTSHTLVLHLDN